jgi:CBS domain containing-hemolysin-like protein
VLLLVVVNAAFAGSEVALISLREGQLRRLEQEGERGRLVAQLARDPNQFLSTIQIGITLAGFLASAAAAVALAEPLVPYSGSSAGRPGPVAHQASSGSDGRRTWPTRSCAMPGSRSHDTSTRHPLPVSIEGR